VREESPTQAFVVWGENPWPPTEDEAEALATALCEILGAGYFEPFLALIKAGSPEARERLLRRAGAPRDVEEKRAMLLGEIIDDEPSVDNTAGDVKTAAPIVSSEEAAHPPDPNTHDQNGDVRRTPLFALDEIMVEGQPEALIGSEQTPSSKDGGDGRRAASRHTKMRTVGYGGHTDLDTLNGLGMSIALVYERNRLRRADLKRAQILDPSIETKQPDALVFDLSSPRLIERARALSRPFDSAIVHLQKHFGVSPEWPGFDILSLDPRREDAVDRLIELKSSGVDANMQEMSWNEWKASSSPLRPRYFLYLVGNLRSDLKGAVPYVRTVQDPFGQLESETRVTRTVQRKVQLAVRMFKQAEHLDLTIVSLSQ